MNDFDPQADGSIIFSSRSTAEYSLHGHFVPHDSWQIKSLREHKDSEVGSWELESSVDPNTSRTIPLGRPHEVLKWFALVRHSTPWLGPRQGDNSFKVDKPAVLASFLLTGGTHLVLCPENGCPDIVSTLHNDSEGNVLVRSRNDASSAALARIVIAVGNDFEKTVAAAIQHIQSRLPGLPTNSDVQQKQLSDWYDGFSYCTWNGLGRELNEEKIQTALTALSEKGLTVPNLIIDDNWQSLDNTETGDPFTYRWTDFEANKKISQMASVMQ